MDDQSHDDANATSMSGSSRISERGRRIAMAEEDGRFRADRSAWAARWQHPLVKSIEVRRGKASQF
jgi:hypothetical protein